MYLGQYPTPLYTTPGGGMMSTVQSGTLSPSQTMTWLDTQAQLTGSSIYTRKILPQVGQPYTLKITDEQALREVYKDIPTKVKEQPAAKGTEPQKIIVLKSGLEVPAYILKRDAERQKTEKDEAIREANYIPPVLEQVGIYTSENPGTAALMALAVGTFAGNLFYRYYKGR